MLNLDTLQTARLIQEQTYPERLERTRIIRQAMDGAPKPRPLRIVALGRLLTRAGTWIQGRPQLPTPEAACQECQQPIPAANG